MHVKDLQYILYSYSVNYPILRDMELHLRKPIALVGSCNMLEDLTKTLSANPVVVDVVAANKLVKAETMLLNSEAFILDCSSNYDKKKETREKNLAMLNQAAKTGVVDDIELCAATFALFEEHIPQKIRNQFFVVYIQDDYETMESDLRWIIPRSEDINKIIEALIINKKDWSPLRAAVQFLLPEFKRTNRMDYFEHLCRMAMEIDDYAENFIEGEEVVSLFEEEVMKFLERYLVKVFELSSNLSLTIEDLENAIVYKNNRAFMKESLFKKIVTPLLSAYSINQLKRLLSEEGALESDKDVRTTKLMVKMDGAKPRIRMLKFNLNYFTNLKDYISLL